MLNPKNSNMGTMGTPTPQYVARRQAAGPVLGEVGHQSDGFGAARRWIWPVKRQKRCERCDAKGSPCWLMDIG